MNEKIDILIVDDEERNLEALEAVLDDPAYRLLRAHDADSALRKLLENDVAAIVLDIKMPGTSGFELAQMIKATKRYRQIPILFLTAHLVEDKDVLTGYGAGGVDYLTKPLNPQIVRHKVAVFADLFRKTRALAELNDTLEQRVAERTAELQKSEEMLRAADRKKDEFIAILAHELRNPLAPLRFGLDILSKNQQSPPPIVQKTLDIMNRQLEHMVRLIDDLLDMSRISRGTIELKRERIHLATVVQSALEINRPFLEKRQHVVTVDLDESVASNADATRITQIVDNLLHNASKFTPDGGSVSVQLERDGNEAVVRVSDSGEGIAADQLERAFDLFARIERHDSHAERGLGIGLALGRRLAELHGGTLTVASDGIGKGSTFTLRLPALAVEAHGEAQPGNDVPVAAADPLDIVLIEDSEDVAETLATWLREMGHRVTVANTGERGIELIQQTPPDVVLCDLGLPEMDGVDVCRRVRQMALARQPRMVALTGWGRDSDRRRTSEAGFDEHLVKPVAVKMLAEVLKRAEPAEWRQPSRVRG